MKKIMFILLIGTALSLQTAQLTVQQETLPKDPMLPAIMAHIESVMPDWISPPWQQFLIFGENFGSSAQNRVVRFGRYEPVRVIEWGETGIGVHTSGDMPYGREYEVFLFDKAMSLIVSNRYKTFIWIRLVADTESDMYAGQTRRFLGPHLGACRKRRVVKVGTVRARIKTWKNEYFEIKVPHLPPGHYNLVVEQRGQPVSQPYPIEIKHISP